MLFNFFRSDPVAALERKRARKYEEAMAARKYGDRVLQAELYAQAEAIERQIASLQAGRSGLGGGR